MNPQNFKLYKTTIDVVLDYDLDPIDYDILFDYVFHFGRALFDRNSKTILINTNILNHRKDLLFKGRMYKIRITNESLSRIKYQGAET